MAELFTNLARSTLASGILSTDLSLTLATGDGNDLFPALSGADFFRCVLFKKATGDIEIITCSARAGDVLTIARAQEQIGNLAATAFDFNAGDLIELRPTKAFFDSLGVVTSTAIQSSDYNYAVDVGSANAYIATLSPAPSAYASPLQVMFLAGNTNTSASTLNVNGLGVRNIKRLDGANIRAGDIVSSEVAYLMYDTVAVEFKLLNPRSSGEPSNYTFDDDVAFSKVASFASVNNYGTVTATTQVVDWNNGNKQELTLGPSVGDNVTLSFTAPPGPCNMILNVKQDASGNRTITWPATVKWPDSSAPTLATLAGKADLISFYYDGSFYYGAASLNY
ncbi:MAG TPA: hypothetical protein ENJ35_11355 [Gammaproteobacteria bacterium]|nr:hypothetical protein [Gammaproteobacteria bacterium]